MIKWTQFVPYLILAFIGGVASVSIAIGALGLTLGRGGTASDTAMLAIAGMSFAPAIMGVGIASHMPRNGQ